VNLLWDEAAKSAYEAYQRALVTDPKFRLRWQELSDNMKKAWVEAVMAAAAKLEETIVG
jgi:hypothetical protein